MTEAATYSNRNGAERINLFDRLAIIFFVFPLLAPAINETVLYPYLLAGLLPFIRRSFSLNELCFILAGAILLEVCAMADPIASLRLMSFYLSCIFFVYVADSPARLNFLITAGVVHAGIVTLQFLLLLVNIEIDFSVALRSIYGALLPGTGKHLDYNALSQLNIFFPRVAGLNREPAFAAVLFLGLGMIAWLQQRRKASVLFFLATLFSLSKVIFALLPSYMLLLWSVHKPACSMPLAIAGRFMVIVVSQLAFYLFLNTLSPLFNDIASLDASFYHRFIGHLTVATDPVMFNLLDSSWEHVSRMPDFINYEFRDFQRGFFDGGLIPKMLLDFGWLPLCYYIVCIAVLSRNWPAALALSFGGLFINLLSVSPATVTTFMNLCAMSYLTPMPVSPSAPSSPDNSHPGDFF